MLEACGWYLVSRLLPCSKIEERAYIFSSRGGSVTSATVEEDGEGEVRRVSRKVTCRVGC